MGGIFTSTESVKSKLSSLGVSILGQDVKLPFKILIPHGRNSSDVKKSISGCGAYTRKCKDQRYEGETHTIHRKKTLLFILFITFFTVLLILPKITGIF